MRDARPKYVLTLGMLGLLLCQVLGIPAAVIGIRELRGMRRGEISTAGRGGVIAGTAIGAVGGLAWISGIVLLVINNAGFFALMLAGAYLIWAVPMMTVISAERDHMRPMFVRLAGVGILVFAAVYGIVGSGAPFAAFMNPLTMLLVCGFCTVGFLVAVPRDVPSAARGIVGLGSVEDVTLAAHGLRGARVGVLAGVTVVTMFVIPGWWRAVRGTDTAVEGFLALVSLLVGPFWAMILAHLCLLPLQISTEARIPHRPVAQLSLTDHALEFWVLAAGFIIAGLFAATITAL